MISHDKWISIDEALEKAEIGDKFDFTLAYYDQLMRCPPGVYQGGAYYADD